MTKPASKVRSPTDGTCVGTTPTYSVWFENSTMDTTTPISMATGPAQFAYLLSNSSVSSCRGSWRRRRNWSQNITASHGAIQ